MPANMSVSFKSGLVVVVGRLALFCSQVPTAETPLPLWLHGSLYFTLVFSVCFLFPMGHEFLVFSVIFGVSI